MYLQIRYIPWLVKTLSIITNLGSPATYVLVSILVFIGLGWKRQWLEAGFSYLCLLSTWGLMEYLKIVFYRARPSRAELTVASGFSMPSGHAMVSFAYYGFLALLLLDNCRKRWRYLIISGFLAAGIINRFQSYLFECSLYQ
jgi:undecaprenyl-diphosphatase